MKTVTMTELRRNLFQLVDEAVATGEPIVIQRKGARIVLRGEQRMIETEDERAERWSRFWAQATPPGWEDVDLLPEDVKRARAAYWRWDEEPELSD